jgi:hypothetical protein
MFGNVEAPHHGIDTLRRELSAAPKGGHQNRYGESGWDGPDRGLGQGVDYIVGEAKIQHG